MVKVKPERRSSVTSGQSSVTDSTSVSGNMVLAGLGKNDGKLINVLCVTFYECGKRVSISQYLKYVLHIIDDSSVTSSMGSTTQVITNGFCSFSPTSTKGKWIFIVQTVLMSFTPIVILLLQNGDAFYQMVKEKEEILHKNELVMIYTIYIQMRR